MSAKNRRILIRRLMTSRQKLIDAELFLKIKGKTNKAKKMDKREQTVGKQVKRLKMKIMQDWIKESASDAEELRKKNEKLQRKIRDLKNDVESVNRFTEALKAADEIIGFAAGLV